MLTWIKTHKLTALLAVLVAYFLIRPFFTSLFGVNISNIDVAAPKIANPMGTSFGSVEMGAPLRSSATMFSDNGGVAADIAPSDRVIIQNSNLSLLVEDVRKTGDAVVQFAESAGGFMVGVSYNRPEESPFATITVRIPSTRLNEALSYFRSQAIKVSNENLVGDDVTDQYVDIEARLTALEQVKTKFESILSSATEVQDILTVQREIINTQAQIDSLKGQKLALEENAKFAKLTVYLSTDELSLPYTPDTKFRPDVVFKLAIRSLLNSLRVVGEGLIWLIVYGVIWVPILLGYLLVSRWWKRRTNSQKQ